MKNPFFLAMFILLGFFSYSQDNHKIDSLLNLVKKTPNDSIKSYIYSELSDECWFNDPDGCEKYAFQALKYAKKINSHFLMCNAYACLSNANYFLGNNKKSLQYSKLSYDEALKTEIEAKIMRSAGNLGSDYYSNAKYDSAIIVLNNGIKYAKTINNSNSDDYNSYLSSLLINKGNCYYALLKYDSSEYCFNSALNQAIVAKDTVLMAKCFNNIAFVRISKGLADSSTIEMLFKAININEKNKDFLTLGDNFVTLASVYNIRKNDEKTILYLRKGIATFERANNTLLEIPALVSLADKFRELNQLDSAIVYADKAIKIGELNNYKNGLATAYSIMGHVESNKSNYIQAEKYLYDAYKEFNTNGNGEGFFLAGNALVNVLGKQNKNKEALKIGKKIFLLSDSIQNFSEIKTISLALAQLYHNEGNDKEAYTYMNKYIFASDTIMKLQNTSKLEDITAKYESSQKDLQIVNLKNEKLSREKNIIQLIYLFVSLGIIAGILTYFYNRKIKFQNEKKELSLNKQIIETKQEALNAQMNAHFVSRTMDSINNFIRNNDKEKASEYLLLFSRLTRKVIGNSLKKSISISEDIELLNDYIKLEKLRFPDYNLIFKVNIDSGILLESTLVPPMIFQTLMENSIVHGLDKAKGGEILLEIHREANTLHCALEDNGVGHLKPIEQYQENGQNGNSIGIPLAVKLAEVFNGTTLNSNFKILNPINYNEGSRVEFVLNYISTE